MDQANFKITPIMNKVITINLGGNAYQLEEGGYDLLRTYLETAATRLHHNPDQEEILTDIEGAIAEKFRQRLAAHKSVVTAKEMSTVLDEMGPVQADGEADDPAKPGASEPTDRPEPENAVMPKRLYRIYDGAMVSGVCNGMGAYLNIDPTLVRLAFVLLTVIWGTGLLVYVILAIVVPEAQSPEEKASASGLPPTAQEFIRRAKSGYYEAVKNFQAHGRRHAWIRWFHWRTCGRGYPWHSYWRGGWAPATPLCPPWTGFAVVSLAFLSGTATVVWLCALTSLLATGTLLGLTLPAGLPVWAAALMLLVAYGALAGALKTLRWLSSWSRDPSARPPAAALLAEALVWLSVTLVLLVLASHFFAELRAAVHAVPALIHQATDDFHAWWGTR